MTYFLESLDPDDSFSRNTQGNGLRLSDLKIIAQDRISEHLTWDDKFQLGQIYGYIIDGSGEKTQRYVINFAE